MKTTLVMIGSILAGTAANVLGSRIAAGTGAPIFLDATFTIVVAAMYGPVAGSLVGLLTNVTLDLAAGFPGFYLAFAPLNMATGAIVGIMRVRGRFRTVGDSLTALVIVAFVNSLLGAVLFTILYRSGTIEGLDVIIASLILAGNRLWWSAFVARVPTNLADKALGVVLALVITRTFRFDDPGVRAAVSTED